MKKITKSNLIFFTFFMLVIANSKFLINKSWNSYFEYFALGLLTLEILFYFYKGKSNNKPTDIFIFMIVCLLFCIGLIFQNLDIFTKLRLILTMIALAVYIILSSKYLNNYKNIRAASYGLIFGILATTTIALITGTSVLEKINDTAFSFPIKYAFTGGMQFKNFLSTTILASFMGLLLYYRHEKKQNIDLLVLFFLGILEIITVSRGGYILFLLFVLLEFLNNPKIYKKIPPKKFSPGIKIIFSIIIIFVFIIFGSFTYKNFILKSKTYAYRIRGVENYLKFVKKDKFHLYFGYSEMAFKKDDSYIWNIRKFLKENKLNGYNGSYEMGFINTLIKNGVIGLLGFLFSYIYIIKKALSLEDKRQKILIIGIFIILLISSLVESYVCNIHQIFGIYCYLLMSGLLEIRSSKEINEKSK